MITLFIRERNGDNNYEQAFQLKEKPEYEVFLAQERLKAIRQDGGYWTRKGEVNVFIPWHNVIKVELERS
jgi:hypothetical protein